MAITMTKEEYATVRAFAHTIARFMVDIDLNHLTDSIAKDLNTVGQEVDAKDILTTVGACSMRLMATITYAMDEFLNDVEVLEESRTIH